MANVIADGSTKQYWMPAFQRALEKRMVSKSIADIYTGPDRIIHNPYNNYPAKSDGTAATAYATSDFTTFDDTLTVSRRATAAEHIDNIEQLQSRYDLMRDRARKQGYVVADAIDQYMLALPTTVSGVDVIAGGATSSSNIDDLANTIRTNLMLANSSENGLFWAISPYEAGDITAFSQANGFDVADYSINNGFTGRVFGGLNIIVTNNLYHTTSLGLATNPTAGDTFTINGVTWTFRAVPALAGEIDIGADADATRVIVANAVNGSATGKNSATGYFEVSERDRRKLDHANVVATDVAASDLMTLTANQTLIVSETLTNGTDTWATVVRHTIAGVKGALFGAIPSGGKEFAMKDVTLKHGKEVVTSQIYNGTIWEEMKDSIFDVTTA